MREIQTTSDPVRASAAPGAGDAAAPELHADVLRLDLGGGAGARMADAVVEAALAMLARGLPEVLDLHGRPPESHPRFLEIAILARALRRRVVHRCCLLAVAAQPGAELAERLADIRVDVVTAQPWNAHDGADEALAARCVEGLRRLNAAGYGADGGSPRLDLVASVSHAGPADARGLERAWREALARKGARFDRLHLVRPPPSPGPGLVAHLQSLAVAVPVASIVARPCRCVLTIAPDGTRRRLLA